MTKKELEARVAELEERLEKHEPKAAAAKGLFYRHTDGEIYILAATDEGAVLIALSDGNRWSNTVKVDSHVSITRPEFSSITSSQVDDFTPINVDIKEIS